MFSFAQVPQSVLTDKNLKPEAIRVYSIIDIHSNTKGYAWPGITRISEMADLSRPTVIDSIKALEAGGHILVKRENRKVSIYFLPFRNTKLVNAVNQSPNQTGKRQANLSGQTGKRRLPEVDFKRSRLKTAFEVDKTPPSAALPSVEAPDGFFQSQSLKNKKLEEAVFDALIPKKPYKPFPPQLDKIGKAMYERQAMMQKQLEDLKNG